MKHVPHQIRKAESALAGREAAFRGVAFTARLATDALAELGFALNCAAGTDEAKRAEEISASTLARAQKK